MLFKQGPGEGGSYAWATTSDGRQVLCVLEPDPLLSQPSKVQVTFSYFIFCTCLIHTANSQIKYSMTNL